MLDGLSHDVPQLRAAVGVTWHSRCGTGSGTLRWFTSLRKSSLQMGTAVVAAVALTLSPPALVGRAVAANEALYRDIDVTYRAESRLADPRRHEWLARTSDGGLFVPVLARNDTVRVGHQGERFRVTAVRWTDAGDGPPTMTYRGEAFDGTTTRVREGARTGATAGPQPPPREAYFPHLWATGPLFQRFPLSAFLAGGAVWDTHPGRYSAYRGQTVTRTLLTPGPVEAEPCVVVRCASAGGSRASTVSYYWLAPGKNYLPVRVVSYLPHYSPSLPIQVVTAGDFRELRPGVWLPSRLTKTVYDELDLRENQVALVSNTTTTTVTRAVLNPNHDPAFFRDLRAEGE